MQTFGSLLCLLGVLVQFVGYIMLLVSAKRVSSGWLVACLFGILVPFFLIAHWSAARKAFCVWAGGLLVLLIEALLGGAN